jgi:exonuclease SbcC
MKLKGFTSFRDEQVIDFRDLDLFALWGPTGSGKSSLLDAMTYALFGHVERVGTQTTQLVSQGQPRMAVTLDFTAGDKSYRVTRSTPSRGGASARLEELQGNRYVTSGPGADTVRGVNRMVVERIGLDYEAFTRSVVLPQGKFAEFLVGDANKRRDILTELLGLELFEKMARRANELKREAANYADTKQGVVDSEYADVSAAAVAEAEAVVTAARAKATSAAESEKELEALWRAWHQQETAREAVRACAGDIRMFAEDFTARARDLEDLVDEATEAKSRAAQAREGEREAAESLEEASKRRAEAEDRWGSRERIADLRVEAHRLVDARSELEAVESSVTAARAKETAHRSRLAESERSLDEARAMLKQAADAVTAQEARHEAAHREDMVGSLVAGLHPGAPCPVCERPLEAIPHVASGHLESAQRELVALRDAKRQQEQIVASADRAHAAAERALQDALEGVARCAKELDGKAAKVTSLTEELARETFAGELPEEPHKELSDRLRRLEELTSLQESAQRHLETARRRALDEEAVLTRVNGRVAAERAALDGAGLRAALQRIEVAAPNLEIPPLFPDELPDDASELASIAAGAAKELDALHGDLEDHARERRRVQTEMMEKARRSIPADLEVWGDDIDELIDRMRDAKTTCSTAAALAEREAASMREKLVARTNLEEQIAGHRVDQATYSDLQKELKNDSIVQFLQAEALCVLAAGATEHLWDLSNGRYRLVYEGDRFFVVDSWNGEERRHVRTLSGGETFLASLALALALSEQVQLLAVSERRRLDSLFLDEGFGTLDAEALEEVIQAIEQLGGDGRLVGVITHVPELAERLPVRLEVTKSPRGSSVRRTGAEAAIGLEAAQP